MMKKKWIAALFILLPVLAFVTGCGQEDTPEPPVTETGTGTTVAAVTEETTPPETTGKEPVSNAPQIKKSEILPISDTVSAIHVNQIGYRPGDVKRAIVVGGGSEFMVVEALTGNPVYTGTVTAAEEDGKVDELSGDVVCYADFTDLTTDGYYYIYASGVYSFPFTIGEDVNNEVRDALLKFFYYQRCGTALTSDYAGVHTHRACHMAKIDGVDYTGGWHDAGDYARYTALICRSIARMLMAYTYFPTVYVSDDTGIPESGNGIPDMLDEVQWAIDWLQKVTTDEGGVYSRVGPANNGFSGVVMPDTDPTVFVLYPISIEATLMTGACYARYSRCIREYDAALADAMLEKAKLCYDFAKQYPTANFGADGQYYDETLKAEMRAGYYQGSTLEDETLWILSELYACTGDTSYNERLSDAAIRTTETNFIRGGFGMVTYLMDCKEQDPSIVRRFERMILKAAEGYYETYLDADYDLIFTAMNDGSNSVLLDDAAMMYFATRLDGTLTEAYQDAICQAFNYVMGQNAVNYCFVTGFGTVSPMHPHHAFSATDHIDEPVPGMMVAGTVAEGVMARYHAGYENYIIGRETLKVYADVFEYYRVNEEAIYWNASALLVAAMMTSEWQ